MSAKVRKIIGILDKLRVKYLFSAALILLFAQLVFGASAPRSVFAAAAPDSTRTPTDTLQWQLPVARTITSQFGHRVDPITGKISSHTSTDIACAEGTLILAAADGTVTVDNVLDS